MSLAAVAIEKRAVTYFSVVLLALGGIASFFQLGWLEDPEYTVKTAAITVPYPGAAAASVELEVTDLIETKLQEMVELKEVYSYSRPGLAIIKAEILPAYWADELPQVWDVLRKKVRDVEGQLPPGAGPVDVADDFGFVLGFLLAVTGDGFGYAELEDYAKELRKELSVVPGVARIDLWGARDERVYVDVSQAQLSELGITRESLQKTLAIQNAVVNAGLVDVQDQRYRIAPTGEFETAEDIGQIVFRGDSTLAQPPGSESDRTTALISPSEIVGTTGEIIQLRDFATVSRGYAEPPSHLMRFGGAPSIALAAAPLSGTNVVEVGRALDEKLAELEARLPIGIDVHRISWQSDMVLESIRGFMINLIEAVLIVLVVLALTMGLRMGVIIGVSGLVLAILGTFMVMAVMGIDLQRVSLGALVIAMGMMVDNAIVVADGIVVRMQNGMDRRSAAIESATQPAWPLLGATVVASMAFYPIFASPESTGEYARSLFQVVAISLVFSWLLSQTITPLMCMEFLPEPARQEGADAYGGRFYQRFRALLAACMRRRIPFLAGMVGLLALSIGGFRFVPQLFFPDSSRLQLMIDYWLPDGTRIEQTSRDLEAVEAELLAHPEVTGVATFVGKGPPRFYLPVDPEMSYSSYGQLVVNTETLAGVDDVIDQIIPWLDDNAPQALSRVRKYGVGSWDDWQFEARFSGPYHADPAVLRGLAAQGVAILEANPLAKEVRTNWRNRVRKLVPEYVQQRGRWSNVTRADLADATRRAYDGIPVGLFRERDRLIPIVMRSIEDERVEAAAAMDRLQISPTLATITVPLGAVTRGVEVEWEDPVIHRWNRRRAITVQASPRDATFPQLRASALADFEAIELPPGYTLEWDGEYRTSSDSQRGLVPGFPPAVVLMTLIIVALFNAFRPPIIIFAVIPFAAIGITLGLLVTQIPFGFMSLLGAMSLAGMMIKNSVVLLDQVNLNLAEGMSPYRAVVESAVSRLRPVVNAAATTVLGMAPLLQDEFWQSMAVTIMGGLAFGTVLTMVVVPVLYATLYRIEVPAEGSSG
jgi:multidrug efflux pump subunit AcrB